MQQYLSQREELISTAAPGITSARRLARLTDDVLLEMSREASARLHPSVRWALIALGGYGSGALLPSSDLDLLVVSNGSSAKLKPFVEAILYPLWDAGLKVGHQVRSRREQVHAVRADLATLTATLTGRTIAGDDRLGADTLHACALDARKRSSAVIAQLQSRPRPGSPYLLEPDLKEGAGGRRDFDELTWTAAVLTGAPQSDPSALVSLGILEAAELDRLLEGADAVAAARWELMRANAGSRLAEDSTAESKVDLGRVQRALADTHHLLLRARDRVIGRNDAPVPSGPFDVFGAILDAEDPLPGLETAAWSGRLDPIVPGFSDLMTLRRPGLAHTLTVGAHCLTAAVLIGRIGTANAGEAPLGGQIAALSAAAISDVKVPIAAALVHDIGKAVPGPGHAKRGAGTARAAAERLGLDHVAAEDVASLVRLHLALPETASREDLDTEDALLRAAAAIGDRRLLAPLHLLTVADSIATGPSAWTPWHEALIGKLVVRLDAALSPDVDGAGIATLAEETRAAASALVGSATRQAEFVASAPVRYLADGDPERVARHASLVAGLAARPAAGGHEVEIGSGPLHGSYVLTVAARDRHGLFSTVAGVLALSGFDILGAQAFTVPGGIALDTFTVRSATLAEIDPDAWARFDRALDAALRDRLAIGVRLAERQRHYRQPKGSAVRVTVGTHDPYSAVVTVRAADRVGLLYDVSRAIAESGLDIVGVTATTKQARAIDTFRVIDRDGQIPAEGLLGQLGMRLRELR